MQGYNGILSMVRRQSKGLRIRLNVDSPELMVLPWEFLYSPQDGFCSLTRDISLVRSPGRDPRPYKAQIPLHMVILSSNPEGSVKLNLQRESRVIKDALEALIKSKEMSLEHIEAASLSDLRRRLMSLSDAPPHILHYMGHGDLDRVLLEDEVGASKPLSGGSLAVILGMMPSIQLVVLNACESGQPDISDMRLGVANALAMAGIPAVIAMQFRISDDAALAFSKGLYEALAAGHPIDTAVVWARVTIHSEFSGNTVEWGTPALYMLGKKPLLYPFVSEGKTREDADIRPLKGVEGINVTDIKFIIQQLNQEREEERLSTAMALTTIGKPAIKPLIEALPSMNKEAVEAACVAFLGIGKPAVRPLIEAFPQLPEHALLLVASILDKIGVDEEAEPAIEDWINTMHNADQHTMARNAAVMAMLGQSAVRPLMRALVNKNPSIRLFAVIALQFRERKKI